MEEVVGLVTRVTVCIPAYRSEPFIHHTLASVQNQSFEDLEVDIGVEPVDADATIKACDAFLEDSRFHLTANTEVLGYAGNVGALLRRVRTPLFVVLPHDDVWHPRFLERLYEVLQARPDAVCAYTDCLRFGPDGRNTGIAGQAIGDAALSERVVSWFLGGAGGFPWRGLTRSVVLCRDYPDNAYNGFAVECEWSLHLLLQGRVLHVPEPLYLKRQPTSETPDSVSASWFRDAAGLQAALDHHRRQLLAMIPDGLPDSDGEIARLAAETAVLRRRQEFARGRWGLTPTQAQNASDLLEAVRRLEPTIAIRMTATLRWVLSRHCEACGDKEEAERHVRLGLAAAPDDAFLSAQLGRVLLGRDEILEALEVGLQASRAHPNDAGIQGLVRSCEAKLEQRLRPIESHARGAAVSLPSGREPGARHGAPSSPSGRA